MKRVIFLLFVAGFFTPLFAQKDRDKALSSLSAKEQYYGGIAKQIWGFAEVGYQETKSSALLQQTLSNEGFKIEAGVAGIPTAFIASYGSGKPVIAILGEYDALPGLSQDSIPEKHGLGGIAGHACGHHLFGTASSAAAITVKEWMIANHIKGTLRMYGCPAEEGGSGKVYMVRDGLFNDVDVVVHWHPGASNGADASSSLANKSAKFRFYGVSAHAAASPEKGRSALDGVESFDYMINMMREHVPSDTRIHYVITNGGKAPNVVPDFAEVYYYCRHPNRQVLLGIWDRMEKAAQGAAMGTGTRVDWEVIGGTYEVLVNETLGRVMHKNLERVGGVQYTAEEQAFATSISKSMDVAVPDFSDATGVKPFAIHETTASGGSTDVGDISWTVPTVGLRTATWAPGTPAHSWQAVAAGGMSIGRKGMMVAAKTLSLTTMDLFENKDGLIEKAKVEFEKRRGKDFKYVPLLGDRKPALNYRNGTN